MNYGCRAGYPHSLKVEADHADAVVERCVICGDKKIYRKNDRKQVADETTYFKDHIRDLCQPYGPTSEVFALVYGKKRLHEIRKNDQMKRSAQERERDLETLRKDMKKSVGRIVI